MSRHRDPATGRLLIEGVHPVVSSRTGAVTYRARLSYGPADRRQHQSRTFKHASNAEDWVLSLRMDLRRGTALDSSQVTVADYHAQWFARMAPQWSGSRQTTVRMVWDKYARDYFGAMRLQSVTRATVQRFVDLLVSCGLSPSSIGTYMAGIDAMLGAATRDGILTRNPAQGVTLPKRPREPRPVWSPLQMRRFLSVTRDDPYGPVWAFLVATGCRIGEAIALDWRSVDLERGQVWIHRTLSRDPDGIYRVRSGTKTEGRGRTVPLDGWIMEMLRSLPRQGEFVFHDGGEQLKPGTLNYQWKAAIERSGLPLIRIHDVRHSVASALVSSGVNMRVIQEILGHKNVGITMNTYSHVDVATQRQGTSTLTRLLGLEETG